MRSTGKKGSNLPLSLLDIRHTAPGLLGSSWYVWYTWDQNGALPLRWTNGGDTAAKI